MNWHFKNISQKQLLWIQGCRQPRCFTRTFQKLVFAILGQSAKTVKFVCLRIWRYAAHAHHKTSPKSIEGQAQSLICTAFSTYWDGMRTNWWPTPLYGKWPLERQTKDTTVPGRARYKHYHGSDSSELCSPRNRERV